MSTHVSGRKIDVGYITFLECRFTGNWDFSYDGKTITYTSTGNTCRVAIVRNDGLRRTWQIKEGNYVSIRESFLIMSLNNIDEEITIDEDEQQGKQSLNKVF